MNTLLFLFYLIDISVTVKATAFFVTIVLGILALLGFVNSTIFKIVNSMRTAEQTQLTNPLQKTARNLIIMTVLAGFVWIATPTKNAMQVIVAGKAAQYSFEYITESPIMQKSKFVIESKLDEIIKDMDADSKAKAAETAKPKE